LGDSSRFYSRDDCHAVLVGGHLHGRGLRSGRSLRPAGGKAGVGCRKSGGGRCGGHDHLVCPRVCNGGEGSAATRPLSDPFASQNRRGPSMPYHPRTAIRGVLARPAIRVPCAPGNRSLGGPCEPARPRLRTYKPLPDSHPDGTATIGRKGMEVKSGRVFHFDLIAVRSWSEITGSPIEVSRSVHVETNNSRG
jgi:hypothetical protein